MSLSKKLKLLSQSQSNKCHTTSSWLEKDYKFQSASAQVLDFRTSQDPEDIVNNNRVVVMFLMQMFLMNSPSCQSMIRILTLTK